MAGAGNPGPPGSGRHDPSLLPGIVAEMGIGGVARFYYAPGRWEGSASNTTMVNAEAWDALPPKFKAAFECGQRADHEDAGQARRL